MLCRPDVPTVQVSGAGRLLEPHRCYGAKRSRLQPIKDVVTLIENHWDGIIAWHHNHLSNGLLEGINSLVQAAKARARGYRSKTKMITIVYLATTKLPYYYSRTSHIVGPATASAVVDRGQSPS